MPASLNRFQIYYNVLKDALWLHLFYRKLLGPLPHLCQSKSILRDILFPSVLLFYVLPSTSFSFLKSLASSYILLSLWPEWQSDFKIQSSSSALRASNLVWDSDVNTCHSFPSIVSLGSGKRAAEHPSCKCFKHSSENKTKEPAQKYRNHTK